MESSRTFLQPTFAVCARPLTIDAAQPVTLRRCMQRLRQTRCEALSLTALRTSKPCGICYVGLLIGGGSAVLHGRDAFKGAQRRIVVPQLELPSATGASTTTWLAAAIDGYSGLIASVLSRDHMSNAFVQGPVVASC